MTTIVELLPTISAANTELHRIVNPLTDVNYRFFSGNYYLRLEQAALVIANMDSVDTTVTLRGTFTASVEMPDRSFVVPAHTYRVYGPFETAAIGGDPTGLNVALDTGIGNGSWLALIVCQQTARYLG